ncbi:hypothetical protein F5Y04DRAFT_266653 [Hypomontagnella monticulosa]|nr:hypothetical protein F5Y04DRAFT_266653 [Hypomontagnella monticulosa]
MIMGELLTGLPPEIFSLILGQLSKTDLKVLSCVSKPLHAVVAKTLWHSITIRPLTEYDLHRLSAKTLPQTCLQLARELHFRSSFEFVTRDRCPHSLNYLYDEPSEVSSKYEDEDEDEDPDVEPFERLAQKTKALLQRLEDNQLHTFSWDLGTCVPSGILGYNGIIPLKQPFLRSLSLTTDSLCREDEGLDLSSLRSLQNLHWKAIHAKDVSALSFAIKANRAHLRTLELDFVNWQVFLDYLDLSSDEEDGNDQVTSIANSFFLNDVLGLQRRRPRLLLPQLRILNLTQVPLVAAMAHAVNFDTLRSLTLRMCPGWCDFIVTALELKVPLRLTALEIQETDTVSHGNDSEFVIQDLLSGFEGLEELFISQSGPVGTLGLWNTIARYHPTLRRFVHHQRTVNIDEEAPDFEEEHDVMDLAIYGRSMRNIKEDPLGNNPLARLNLERIGLCCLPERLKNILLPYKSMRSLKFLHIRQSASDLKYWASWFQDTSLTEAPVTTDSPIGWGLDEEERDLDLEELMATSGMDSGPTSPISDTEDAAPRPDDEENAAVAESGRWEGPKFRPETRRFANWAFGPHGIPSLQVIALGDYAHGGRATRNNSFLCKCTEESRRFRYVDEYEPMAKEIREEYHNVLEACPVEPLLGGGEY